MSILFPGLFAFRPVGAERIHCVTTERNNERVRLAVFALALSLLPTLANAYYSPPRTVPAQPLAGEAFQVVTDMGGVHGFIIPPFGEPQPRVEIDGQMVRVYQVGSIGMFGVIPPHVGLAGTLSLPPGDYTIEVHMIRFPQLTEIYLGSTTVNVRGAINAPTVIPAASVPSLLAALLAIAFFGWRRLTR